MKIINECWALLSSLKWDTKICIPGGAGLSVNLAQLLEDWMVSGDVVDMMVQHLKNHIKQDTVLRYDMSELWETGRGAEMQAVEAAERNRSFSLHRVKTWPQLMCCALV